MDHSMHDMHAMHDMAAASGFDYTLALVAGILGSGHCLGMCGALVSGYFMKAGGSRSYLPYFAYQLTRIFVYTMVGFAAAALGFVLVSSGMFGKIQSILQMGIGTVVIVLAMGILGWIPFQGSVKLIPMNVLRKGYATASQKGPVVGAMIAGFLNGLMPCPLTFAMAVKATTAATVVEGGALMLAFGAGTLPTMLLVSVAFGKLGAKVRGLMLKSAAFVMIFMGLNTFYSGLSFYVEEDFKHRTFLHVLKEEIDGAIVFLGEMLDYVNTMMSNIQGM
ncbi:sulfite exporter TauE/SafE family protein [Methylomarinum vadi]|uniref:sulfite exporter TauE/SafE family protein n=1 Tax=Methylomarinum vadi TaxID=438855 RepID=UPI0004DEDF87|nr:sulfite exporter TauE/SafE family protein [Methylomarinum vadi]